MKSLIVILAGLCLWGCSVQPVYVTVKVGEFYGAIDSAGQMILPPQPWRLDQFSDGPAVWFCNPSDPDGRYGLMHVSGRVLVPPKYHRVEPFHEGFAWVCTHDDPEDRSFRLWTVVDQNGRERFEPRRYKEVFDFSQGAAFADVWDFDDGPDLYPVIDPDGREIYKPEQVKGFAWFPQEGLVDFHVLQEGHEARGKIGFVDRSGKFAVAPTFSDTGRFSQGRCWVREAGEPGEFGIPRGGRLGYIDRRGRWLFDVQADEVRDFHEGRAVVRVGKKHGFIDEKGWLVILPVFDAAFDFNEGLSPVQTDAGWGVIDRYGKWVIAPRFFEISSPGFRNGLAFVWVARADGRHASGYINRSGRWVFPPGLRTGPVINGLVPLQDQFMDPVAYADLQGRYIWPPDKRGRQVQSPSSDPRDRVGETAQ